MKRVRSNQDGWFSVAMVILLFGVMTLIANKENIKSAFTGTYDIYDVDASDIKIGDGIKTDIYAVLDTFGTLETTTKNSKTGNVTGKTYHYYYIIPVFEGDDTYYMAVKVSSDDKPEFDRIADDTWSYLVDDTDSFTDDEFAATGNIQKLDGEGYEYMVEWFEDMEWFDSSDRDDFEEYLLPICLEIKDLKSAGMMVYAGIGLIILGILIIVIHFVRKANRKKKAEAQQAAYNSGYAAAQNGATAGRDNNAGDMPQTDSSAPVNNAGSASNQAYAANTSYSNGAECAFIGGMKVLKADMDRINSLVAAGDAVSAIKELRDITGIGINEAKDIIDNWGNYYR